MEAVDDSKYWDVAIGDPVKVTKSGKQDSVSQQSASGPELMYEITFLGPARSYEIGDTRFQKGKTRLSDDDNLVKKCTSTPGFQVRLTTRGLFDFGRVLTIYLDQKQFEFFDDGSDAAYGKDRYDFIVVAPNGVVVAADDIRRATEEEIKQLNQEEMDQLMNGEQPYRHRLKMVGKGQWGLPNGESK